MPFQTPSFYSKLKENEQKQRFGLTSDTFLRHSEWNKCVIFLKYITYSFGYWLSYKMVKVVEIRKMTSVLNGLISPITPILALYEKNG